MRQKKMKTNADRLRWVVGFAREAVSDASAKQVREELRLFLGGSQAAGETALQVPIGNLANCSVLDLEALRQDAHRLCRQTASATSGWRIVSDLGKPLAGQVLVDIVPGETGARCLRLQSGVRTGFVLALGFLLAGAEGERVRDCPWCRRLFVRTRRQIYCSRECTNRATWASYPEAKKRASRKRQYDKQGWSLGARRKKAKK